MSQVSWGGLSPWPRHFSARAVVGRCLQANLPVAGYDALFAVLEQNFHSLSSKAQVAVIILVTRAWEHCHPGAVSPQFMGLARVSSCLESSPICYCLGPSSMEMFQHFYFSCKCLLLDRLLSTPIPPFPASLKVSFPSWKSEKPQGPQAPLLLVPS